MNYCRMRQTIATNYLASSDLRKVKICHFIPFLQTETLCKLERERVKTSAETLGERKHFLQEIRPLTSHLKKRWEKWLKQLPLEILIPRYIPQYKDEITSIELHAFSDASISGCCATVYAVVKQEEEVTQGLLVAKPRLAKRDLTIPRLELIGCHMTTNLLQSTSNALAHYPVIAIYAWTDSTVCLHWLQEGVKYKQFVSNRVKKINEKGYIWKYIPSEENPADIGNRGGVNLQANEKWMRGPAWLSTPELWPAMIVTKPSKDSDSEKQLVKEIMQVSLERESYRYN